MAVQSPGGLFGNVTEENLEEEHSTRNARLMRMMEDMHIVENRGSGIKAMLQALRDANLEPPRFDDRRSSFRVVFHNHTLMSSESIKWLNRFSRINLNDRQRLALVYLRQHDHINNSVYRRLNQVNTLVAGQELRSLMQAGLVEQQGASRWTYYTLNAARELPEQKAPRTEDARILAYVREHGSINNAECREMLEVDNDRAHYLLKKLCDSKHLKPKGRGKARRYVIV